MPDYAFASAVPWNTEADNISTVIIMPGVKSIGDNSFNGFSILTSITIPESVTTIGASSIRDCAILTSVNIPEGVTLIKENAFRYCPELTSVTFPSSLKDIGKEAFRACKLSEINLPENLKTIGENAFYSAGTAFTADSYVIIPESVTSIGTGAFEGTSGLVKYIITNNNPNSTLIGNNAFNGPGSPRIYVPVNPVNTFNTTWSLYNGMFLSYYTLKFNALDGVPAITRLFYKTDGSDLITQNFPANPTLDGCIFEGWYTSSTNYSAGNNWITTNTPTSSDIDVFAHWQCVVTFDSQGGSNVPPEKIDYNTAVNEPTPTRPGYTFDGWHTTADCSTPWTFSTKIKKATTIYAKWKANNYTLSFDVNGGKGSLSSIQVTYDEPVGQLPAPARAGYFFGGWYHNNTLPELFIL